ncbi:MAG: hypothetical protein ACYTGS_15670, partial [Planctomycetota bacterium]
CRGGRLNAQRATPRVTTGASLHFWLRPKAALCSLWLVSFRFATEDTEVAEVSTHFGCGRRAALGDPWFCSIRI